MVYWGIPSRPEKCNAHSRPVVCDFSLYVDNPTLQDSQKLVPNDDVTGRKIVQSFLASAIIALILSTTLLFDKIKVLTRKRRRGAEAHKEHQHYVKMVHTIETLLQVLSDQQLISSIALLLSVNAQACQISAYHYNLVCTMLVMGIITHLNTLMNVPDFLHKGKFLAFYRFLGMTIQIILSGLVLSARLTKTFPSRAGPLAILPAACFQEAGSGLGLSALGDLAANATKEGDLQANLDAATSATGGIGEYATLAVFIILAVPIIAFDYIEVHGCAEVQTSSWDAVGNDRDLFR
ncbi:hypothetical protein BJ875DRAFT_490563 [Amylocarpus encephaloides]|uniref:Uncharacterized protein n=1 Tax=Amylocarpus encephaloides TaxID=45428 RepID=A0A9P7Y6Z6_9HELO|nr:hypothetical protein BJ875DRAFT_490563 [Amylocarpus encephaloides]